MLEHGFARRGQHSPEYKAWRAMKRRCDDPNFIVYPQYGGRGISICDRWRKFEHFLSDMGFKPSADHSIDRINPNGNYEPSNCRWATRVEQNLNQRPRTRPTHCKRGHEFTAETAHVNPKNGTRSCRVCCADAARTKRAKRKEMANA